MNLDVLGWTPFFQEHFTSYSPLGFIPARVVSEHKNLYQVHAGHAEFIAEISGKLHYQALSRKDFPVVGDWIALQPPATEGVAIIHALLPRKTVFSRKAAIGSSKRPTQNGADEQILGANLDTILIVNGLDRDFNLQRIERYLTLVYNSGASPVIVLNKADLCADMETHLSSVEAIAFGVPIHVLSAKEQHGLAALRTYLVPGKTVALLGSSGVGKSTIINALLGEARQYVQTISDHVGKGRHTTTNRMLIPLPNGGLIMDNPGLRELQLWGDEDTVQSSFADIEAFALQCRFKDCQHGNEPGCAVQAAIKTSQLDARRLRSYQKQKKELSFIEQTQTYNAQYIEKQRWKKISKQIARQSKWK